MALKVEVAGDAERGIMFGITGESGAGKTTLAATWPKPLVLDLEGGSWVLSGKGTAVHREWSSPKRGRAAELIGVLREVAKTDFKTLVIDSWTRLSTWIESDILERENATNLSTAAGGWGAGQGIHKTETMKVLAALQWLQEHRGLHVVLVMHTLIRTESKPSGETFGVYTHEGNRSSVTQVVQACDVVAQLRPRMTVVAKQGGGGQALTEEGRELITGNVAWSNVKSRFAKGDGEQIIPIEAGVCPFADVLEAG